MKTCADAACYTQEADPGRNAVVPAKLSGCPKPRELEPDILTAALLEVVFRTPTAHSSTPPAEEICQSTFGGDANLVARVQFFVAG
ncbi:hypothetical protein NDU88_004226 [Pleurodeles waltl]|uniref:Uncharacterized protein n=1 Tax=Pleurodeles waltl TaxID=8319 RepID=A0AAV7RF53_PLEWA|nr:hypothetical protein NDU88_004226 [Pleurodeles waltl]